MRTSIDRAGPWRLDPPLEVEVTADRMLGDVRIYCPALGLTAFGQTFEQATDAIGAMITKLRESSDLPPDSLRAQLVGRAKPIEEDTV